VAAQVATAPRVVFGTGDVDKGLSATGHVHEFLPLLLQKDFGDWTTYGGGGYAENQGAGDKNYWYAGWVVQRKITDKLTLGGELYYQASATVAGSPANVASTGFNVGGNYDFSETYHLLFSAGQGLDHVATTNASSFYLGLQTTF
jgi:hypothetical protein